MKKFNHNVKPDSAGRHPRYKHLVMFEIDSHYGSYILAAPGYPGSALISADDAAGMFGDQSDADFAYLSDEYLDILIAEDDTPTEDDIWRELEAM